MTTGKTKRLVSVAKELNVGTATIVDHLKSKGFDIDNKPTSKLTDDMYHALLKEFHNEIVMKEKADQINIGRARKEEEEAKQEVKEVVVEKIETQKVKVEGIKVVGQVDLKSKEEKAAEEKKKQEEKEAAEAEEQKKTAEAERQKTAEIAKKQAAITVAEKEAKKEKKKKAEEKKLEKVEEKKVAKKVEPEKPKKEEPKKAAEVIDVHETELKKLTGPTIVGKIELPKKPEKKKAERVASSDANTDRKKKRRKRITKSVDTGSYANKRGGKRGDKKKSDEVVAVTEKEIQEKIKATMAKLSGGKGKTSKSKYRRQKREDHAAVREEDEMIEDNTVQLTEFITVSELAGLIDVSPTEIISKCFGLGVIVSINQRLDAEIIELVTDEFGYEAEFIDLSDQEEEEEEEADDPADLVERPPIVTIMGHVDHGKTSLLDYIRSANVIGDEHGGITQHIGAYEVTTESGKKITFLDTPGHEAFTAMRARGAKLTDVAVIVIAADDNVMPQTKEAISHAQAAEVPMIFALNKMDRDAANPDRIKDELSQMNILVEDWGGKYQCQTISAKTGANVEDLLEKILLEAELLELKGNPNKASSGSIIEASLDKGRGYVTTLMVQDGTLNVGDMIVAGQHYGKVKAMFNELGKRVKTAGPSEPVLVLGLNGAPQAGEKFKMYESEQDEKALATKRSQIMREQGIRANKHITLDEIGRRLALGNFKELNLIVKGDVDGSIEALADSLLKLSTEEIQVNVIHKSVGQISESDVLLASASDAIIVAFQVRPSGSARLLAERESIDIRTYSIIYDAIDEIKSAMEGMLEPKFEEKIVGNIEIREIFKVSRVGTIAGCMVIDGKVSRNSKIRIIRDGIVTYTGELDSLKRYKDDAKEVTKNMECGLKIKNFNDIKVGDIVEAFEQVEVKRKLYLTPNQF